MERIREDGFNSVASGEKRGCATLGTRVSYRFLRAGQTRHRAAGVWSAALPAALRRSCITGHRINPKSDVARSASTAGRRRESMGARQRIPRAQESPPRVPPYIYPDYLPLLSPPRAHPLLWAKPRDIVLNVIDRGLSSVLD